MKCREFELEVSEWVRGRLPEERAGAMDQHAARCRRCEALVREERRLQRNLQAVRAPELKRDLWPELATRLHQPEGVPSRRPRFTLVRWVLAGAVTAVMAFVLVRAVTTPSATRLASADAEQRVVRMMTDLEPVRYVDADVASFDVYQSHEVQRAVLVGSGSGSR